MDTRAAILRALTAAGEGLAPSQLAKELGLSRQAISRHLARLLEAGEVIRRGKTRNTRYLLTTWRPVFSRTLARPFPDEHQVYGDHLSEALGALASNVADIQRYVFTEMLNNAIDHADARQIELQLLHDGAAHRCVVADDGVGCFENIRAKEGLDRLGDAVAHLSKGKQTTAPDAHSGEGIFFSSKVVDLFTIESNGLLWRVDNQRDDIGVGDSEVKRGTRVTYELAMVSSRRLEAVFEAHSVEPFAFDRTRIHVKLFERGDAFISRSEAKRLLTGLEPFKEIILDYRGVRLIGQGFADQIYRVYQAAAADTRLISINAIDPVAMMIQRAGGVVL